jgi:uncharacterized RDD family membrane protein YckC
MKPSKLLRLTLLAALCAAFCTGTIVAQDADPAPGNEESTDAVTNESRSMDADPETAESETTAATGEESEPSSETRRGYRHANPLVVFGEDAVLKAGETAEAVVVIGGNARVDGDVNAAVVAVMGDIELNGEVHDAVVAVLGNIKLGPGAKVHGDAVSVGGRIEAAPDAVISGHTQAVPFHFGGLPPAWLKEYVVHGVFKLRPLPHQVGWAWAVAGIFIFFYFLVAAIFPRPVQACVEELSRRPATTFLMGFLTKLLLPLLIVVLAVTGIGIIVVPFILAVLFLAGIVGKVALLEWIGMRLGSHFGEVFTKPLLAFFVGAIVLLVLYMIPILGLLTLFITSVWALGCAITAMFGGIRRESPQPAPPLTTTPNEGQAMALVAATPPYVSSTRPVAATPGPIGPIGFAGMAAGAATAPAVPHSAPAAAASTGQPELVGAAALNPPMLPEALSYPRAGFWERLGAGFLDIILVSIASSLVGGTPWGFLVALAYFAGMWAWKGTTVGGIVLGLKVVRADGQQVTFAVALVRGLAAAFSIVVLFLGFLWIAWDPEKQGWHDRIAGTVVIRLPRGTALLTL